jgi:hypothetical protein
MVSDAWALSDGSFQPDFLANKDIPSRKSPKLEVESRNGAGKKI